MQITLDASGDFDRTEKFLQGLSRQSYYDGLDRLARDGVSALANATPVDSGLAAQSWTYEIKKSRRGVTVGWYNTDVESGFPVAIMIQYGHGTGGGGYVQGIDYINPALRPVIDQMVESVWKAVTNL